MEKVKGTKVYGCSDDLIELDGDIYDEVDCWNGTAELRFNDGTLLCIKYGKDDHGGVWDIQVIEKGSLFDRKEECTDEDADVYSDVVYFNEGLESFEYEVRR